MNELASTLQRIAATNELMSYGLITLGLLAFLGVLVTVVGLYRAEARHCEAVEILKEIRSTSDRLGYYLFRKLGPVELP